ncbi:HEAT repeat-containing protein [Xenococcus sp. PCC 7305]|uniref:HEAT repeat domain-containing protein n=1 Tax=Xenococcus sp. PCC 7305 TaxID=102125 RepID=UPI0002AC69E9|nr:HEAT repeat domain-containing protein [Xenococcus sp. PCC 7305]ELS03509.1 HEAT repeat-containing protein [Xenococcus sp. PCC 7305]
MVNSTSQSSYNSCPLTHEEADILLRKVNPQVASNSFDSSDTATIQKMIEGLGDTRGMTRLGFAEALGKVGTPAVSFLMDALQNHPNVVVQRAAAKTLNLIGDTNTVPVLINSFLTDEDQVVRNSCIGALAGIGETSVPPLLEVLANPESDETIKGHAAWALSFIGAKGKEKLYEAVNSQIPEVRSAVIAAIAKIVEEYPEERGFQSILQALQDPSQNVRSEAAAVLGNLKYQPAIPDLVALLSSSAAENRKMAALSLMKIGDRTSLEPLQTALNQEKEPHIEKILQLAISQLEMQTDDDW